MLQELSSGTSYVQFNGTVILLEALPIDEVKRLFPNLSKLKVFVHVHEAAETAGYIANFCTQFPHLEGLSLPGSYWLHSSEARAGIQPDLWGLATAISQLPKISTLYLPTFPFTEAQSCMIVAGLPHLQVFEPPRFSDLGTFFRLGQKPELNCLIVDLSQFRKVVELCRDPVLFPSLKAVGVFNSSDEQLEVDQLKRKLARSRPSILF